MRWDPTAAFDRLWAVGDRRLVGVGAGPGAVADPSGRSSWLPTEPAALPTGPGGPDAPHGAPGASPAPTAIDPWGASWPSALAPASSPAAASRSSGDPLGLPGGLGLGQRGELAIDGLVWLRARAYDPASRSFLSPDPLPGVAGHPTVGNPYHYAANDPVGHADPSGLRPLSDTDLAALRDNWDRGVWDRYGGYIVGGLMIAGGIALMATGVGGIAGGVLIGAAFAGGFSAASQQHFTGGVNWGRVATDTLIGAASGGLGAWAGGATAAAPALSRLGPLGQRVLGGTVENVVGGMAGSALAGQNPFNPRALATDALTGGAIPAAGAPLGSPNPALAQADDMADAARFAGSSTPDAVPTLPTAGGGSGTIPVYRTPQLGRRDLELGGLDPAHHQAGDRSAYVGSESVARDFAHPDVGNYENGYIRYDMDPRFESEFSKYRYSYPGGDDRWEYQIPVEQIDRFNRLTLNREWIPFDE